MSLKNGLYTILLESLNIDSTDKIKILSEILSDTIL